MNSSPSNADNAPDAPCCSLSSGPLSQGDSLRFSQQFKVLADPARLRLLSILCDEGCVPMSVKWLGKAEGVALAERPDECYGVDRAFRP